jgi:hypothetical protein
MNKPLPTFSTLIRFGLEQYLSEVEAAAFISREYNVALPALIIEVLRIVKEVRP